MTSVTPIDVLLHGVGNVGQRLLDLFERQSALLAERHQCTVRVIGAVDRGGALYDPHGLAPGTLRSAKQRGASVASLPGGEPNTTVLDLIARHREPATLMEATVANLSDGEPGLGAIRAALDKGWHVVTANKAPLVLAFQELTDLARARGVGLAFSATVCGGLPVLNVGHYDLAHCVVTRLEGIVNSTTNYLLSEMARGRPFSEALREAQAAGIAEANPTLDVGGWDAANKLIIMANAILRTPTTTADVSVTGIDGITPAMLAAAREGGETIKLLARAERHPDGRYDLTVAPEQLPLDHPLARLTGHEMGVTFETDINGRIMLSITEEDPYPTAAAMLRDLVLLRGQR